MTENDDAPPPTPPPPPLKALSSQDWETVIENFQQGGPRLHGWTSPHLIPALLDQAFVSLLKKDFPLKLPLLLFLEEFAQTFFTNEDSLERLVETLRAALHAPPDGVTITYLFKEQFLVSTTSVLVSLDVLALFRPRCTESLVELLLTVINRPNHGPDRQTRAVACECLRELEKCYPCLLSEVAGHVWSLCQSERTHASQSYILLFTRIINNIIYFKKYNVSILVTSVPLVPFNVPQSILVVLNSTSVSGRSSSRSISSSGCSNISNKDISSNSVGLNYKDLRRAFAFLLESTLVLTPCGMMEFLGMILPMAVALGLQASMLKVQFFGMIYSFDPLLCHGVLLMYSHFSDAFDGQEEEIIKRLMLFSRETHRYLVFRFLSLHWLLGLLSRLIMSKEVEKYKAVVQMGLRFYPAVFDPLTLKALKLDLLAFCSMYLSGLTLKSGSNEEAGGGKSAVSLFEDCLVSVSAFKWLPPWSTETAVAFRAFYRFMIAESSHSVIDPSTTRIFMQSAVLHALQVLLFPFPFIGQVPSNRLFLMRDI
uniref:AP5B1 middle domain-containing protein n=1 Tax=Rhizophora mucronata TaxID=61149 RepID=A0A2P2IM07_RHIMU